MKRLNLVADSLLFGGSNGMGESFQGCEVGGSARMDLLAVCSVFTRGDTGDGTQKVERCVDRWRRNLFLFLSQLSKNVDPNKLPVLNPVVFLEREREK